MYETVLPPPDDHNLSSDLQRILASHDREGISVNDIVLSMGDRGFGILIVLLSLPSALPVPAVGYSIPFGVMLTILGLEIACGRKTPWMPAWALRLSIPRKTAETIVKWAVAFLARIEFLIKRRMDWATHRSGRMFAGVVITAMGIIMAIPIPFTNTFPAFVIFLVGVGMTEKDGLFFVGAAVLGALASLCYLAFFYFVVVYGIDAVTGYFGRT